jgi:hypothetical protein
MHAATRCHSQALRQSLIATVESGEYARLTRHCPACAGTACASGFRPGKQARPNASPRTRRNVRRRLKITEREAVSRRARNPRLWVEVPWARQAGSQDVSPSADPHALPPHRRCLDHCHRSSSAPYRRRPITKMRSRETASAMSCFPHGVRTSIKRLSAAAASTSALADA